MPDYQLLETKMKCVVSELSGQLKDSQELREVHDLIDKHGEYGEAYLLLCFLIKQEATMLTPKVYEEIVRIGELMQIEEKPWLEIVTQQTKSTG